MTTYVDTTPSLQKYIESTFNNINCADTVMEDSSGKRLYVHSFLLKRFDYFKSAYGSGLVRKAEIQGSPHILYKIKIESYAASEDILKYMYTGTISSNFKMSIEDFIAYLHITTEYLLEGLIRDVQLGVIFTLLNNITEYNIEMLINIFSLFGEYPAKKYIISKERAYIPVYKESDYKNTMGQVELSGKYLECRIKMLLEDNVNKITKNILTSQLGNLMSMQNYINVCFKLETWDILAGYLKANTPAIPSFNRYIELHNPEQMVHLMEHKLFSFINDDNLFLIALTYNMLELIDKCKPNKKSKYNQFLEERYDNITIEIFDTKIKELINKQLYVNLLFMYKRYNELNDYDLIHIKNGIKYYDFKDNIFTAKQIMLINKCQIYDPTNPTTNIDQLDVVSFVPFKATYIRLIAYVKCLEGMLSKLVIDTIYAKKIKVGDEYLVDGEPIIIKKLVTNGTNTDKMYMREGDLILSYEIEFDREINKNIMLYKNKEINDE
jgi:hypothetical protein